MKMDKDRSQIPCFWESQPAGCKKPYCPFLHENPKDPYEPETVAANIIPSPPIGGKIIVNKKKLDQITLPNRTVLAPKRSIKERLGVKVSEDTEIFEYTDSEEENLRKGAIKTLDLRSRLKTKRKHSEEEEDYESDHREVRSVVKKVKKESKKKKKDKKEKKSRRHHRNSSDGEEGDTLAKRIAAQRGRSGPGSHHFDPRDRDFRPERSVEITIKNRKIKDRKNSLKEGKESVLSVIEDVDTLLKSADTLPALNDTVKSDDVMKELDELINC